MRAALTIPILVAAASAAGCKAGPGDVDRAGTPAHGAQLFRFAAAGSNLDVGRGQPSALARIGEGEAIAVYAAAAMTSDAPGAYLRTTVQAQRGSDRGRRWQVVDGFADPVAKRPMTYGEPVVLYPGRGTAWVVPGELHAYPVFYSAASDAWRPLPDLTEPVGCRAAADEGNDRAYLVCRDYRLLWIDVRDLAKEGAGKRGQAAVQGEGIAVTVDTEAGAHGTVYVAVSPAVRSDPLRVYSFDGADLGEVGVVPDPEALGEPVQIPRACEGCRFGAPKGYAIVGGKHHIVVEVEAPAGGPQLWHFVGEAGGPFAGARADVDADGTPLGRFVTLQPPLPGKTADPQLVLAREGSCLHVVRLGGDGGRQRTGSLPFALAVNEGGAVVWRDGSLGWLSGAETVDYYLGQPRSDATCLEPDPGDGGGDAGPDGQPDYQTGGNVIRIRRTAQSLDVAIEPGGDNAICGVGYQGTTGHLGCSKLPAPDFCGAAPKAYDERFGMGSLCYDLMLTLTFVDQQGLSPSIDLPRVSGWFEVPTCYGNAPCQLAKGEAFKMTWDVDPAWEGVRIEVRDKETTLLYEIETENDGEHSLPAETFATIEPGGAFPSYAQVSVERFRELPFDFPVAEGSRARIVQQERSGASVMVVAAP